MSNYIDVLLTQDENQIFDFEWDDNGDFLMTEGLETAIQMSVLCEKRADESEVTRPEFRRGDWSNELNLVVDYEVGSKLWLLDQARTIEEAINTGINAIEDGLQWMIDDLLIKDVEASGVLTERGIIFSVSIIKEDNSVDTYYYGPFSATGE